jgi:hypothetical protein
VIGCRFPVTKARLKAVADQARLGGHPIRFEEWLSWESGVVPVGTPKDKKGRVTVVYGPGLVWYPRCAEHLYGWSWEYRRKKRRKIQNRVAVITYMGCREPDAWTPEDEAREQAIGAAEYRRREIIREFVKPIGEKTRCPAIVSGDS